MADDRDPTKPGPDGVGRRDFLSRSTSLAMAGGLAAGYGAFAGIAGRYLYPAKPEATGWVFVTDVAGMKAGDSLAFRTPTGARAAIARRASTGDVSDFIALSSTCPHLGCQVHWESQNNRFFCPCHNGTFDPTGKATGGPPAEAGQSLPRYPLKIEDGLLYIETPLEQLASDGEPATRKG
jgi:Rieske Fe-S protein